jgi:DNA-3-methyladenine glycosylase
MHHHVNLVTTKVGAPHAVLLRAVEPLEGAELMARRRGRAVTDRELTNGPGKLCVAFAIDRRAYGADLCGGALFLADGPRGRVVRSARIGIDHAGEWVARPWRFYEQGNPWVSRTRAPS